MNKLDIVPILEEKAPWLYELSDAIWEKPELAFEERFAADTLTGALEAEGFAVERGVAGMATAFIGRYGQGKPAIGILGEYDALSSMSQKADVFAQEALVPGAPGHGCGHNLLGVGSLAAAIAVKEYLKANQKPGTVIYYGCPGEEGGSGKAFMARAHVFDELDCALTWHPGSISAAPMHTSLANMSIVYRFTGVSAHASASPHMGRSALDALTLMNTGVQFLREHVPEQARIHYAVLDVGGTAPNVVQSSAAAVYLIRMPEVTELRELAERVSNVARGAALMTDTRLKIEFGKSCANLIPNQPLCRALGENLAAMPLPDYTEAELAYAASMCATLSSRGGLAERAAKMGPKVAAFAKLHKDDVICNFVLPELPGMFRPTSSTDVGDVSWVCPCGQAQIATMCAATPGHTWQRTAQGKSALAHKGMLYAGRVLAGAAIDLLDSPELVVRAKEDWIARLDGRTYIPLPASAVPGGFYDLSNE